MASNIIRAAVIDLYNGVGNQGMRGIKEILTERSGKVNGQTILYDIFEARNQNEMPDDSYDLYLSSGGPGSPFDGVNQEWETKYFRLIDKLWNHNQTHDKETLLHLRWHRRCVRLRGAGRARDAAAATGRDEGEL